MKTELYLMGIILGLFILAFLGNGYFNNSIDCSKPFDVVYLTHSELRYAQEIANKINGVVVIKDDNQLIARTQILKCSNFDYSKYIKVTN